MRFPHPAALLILLGTATLAPAEDWYRGNTHTHSLWSDGNDFPEMIVDWYAENGYDFIALSDHNILAEGERWMGVDAIKKRQKTIGRTAMDKYLARFGEDWVEVREGADGRAEVRLKTLEEYRGEFENPGEFLIIQAEEISASFKGAPLHINAVNLEEVIPPINNGASLPDTIRQNLAAVAAQEEAIGRPILAHLNHPNFRWAVTAEQLAEVVEEQFFEVYNGHPGINHMGDDNHPSDEQIWDIVCTLRIAEMNVEPIFGIATDDSHTYHGGGIRPGRGWVMVKAPELDSDELIFAMRRGDFYASTGVFLEGIAYDPESRELTFEIIEDPDHPDATFSTQLIGTREGYDPEAGVGDANGIGEVLATAEGRAVTLTVPEDALYARATITSSVAHPVASFEGQAKQAWTQPVGWRSAE